MFTRSHFYPENITPLDLRTQMPLGALREKPEIDDRPEVGDYYGIHGLTLRPPPRCRHPDPSGI
jgi:hypothetical protein